MRNVKPFPTAKTGLESKILISSLAVCHTRLLKSQCNRKQHQTRADSVVNFDTLARFRQCSICSIKHLHEVLH